MGAALSHHWMRREHRPPLQISNQSYTLHCMQCTVSLLSNPFNTVYHQLQIREFESAFQLMCLFTNYVAICAAWRWYLRLCEDPYFLVQPGSWQAKGFSLLCTLLVWSVRVCLWPNFLPQPGSSHVWGFSLLCTVLMCWLSWLLLANFMSQPGFWHQLGFSSKCTVLMCCFRSPLLPNFLTQPRSSQW